MAGDICSAVKQLPNKQTFYLVQLAEIVNLSTQEKENKQIKNEKEQEQKRKKEREAI